MTSRGTRFGTGCPGLLIVWMRVCADVRSPGWKFEVTTGRVILLAGMGRLSEELV